VYLSKVTAVLTAKVATLSRALSALKKTGAGTNVGFRTVNESNCVEDVTLYKYTLE